MSEAETTSLKNHFLIAMPALIDANFYHAVAYIYEHNDDGAMGIVINKPMRITLGDVLKHLSIPVKQPSVKERPIMHGGPIAPEQGFIIHRSDDFEDQPVLSISHELAVSTSKSTLQAIADGKGYEEVIVSLGYSSWSPGQLEAEVADNAWLVAPVNLDVIFNIPFDKRWRAAAALIGVDVDRLASDAGHA